jgi:hypothetical protein
LEFDDNGMPILYKNHAAFAAMIEFFIPKEKATLFTS